MLVLLESKKYTKIRGNTVGFAGVKIYTDTRKE